MPHHSDERRSKCRNKIRKHPSGVTGGSGGSIAQGVLLDRNPVASDRVILALVHRYLWTLSHASKSGVLGHSFRGLTISQCERCPSLTYFPPRTGPACHHSLQELPTGQLSRSSLYMTAPSKLVLKSAFNSSKNICDSPLKPHIVNIHRPPRLSDIGSNSGK